MKKILFFLLLTPIILLFFKMDNSSAQAPAQNPPQEEKIELPTVYSAPYGVYKDLFFINKLARYENRNRMYGVGSNTHINLGVNSQTGNSDPNTSHGYCTVSGGANNVASAPLSTVGGGINNKAAGLNSVVSGGSSNEANSNYSSIGGGLNNKVSAEGTTVGGGMDNEATAVMSFIGGGGSIDDQFRGNLASGNYSVIGGGRANAVYGYAAAIGGGDINDCNGDYSSIGGGHNNIIRNDLVGNKMNYSSIGGGDNNIVGADYSSIGGGYQNQVNGKLSSIIGGNKNYIGSEHSGIGGGSENRIETDFTNPAVPEKSDYSSIAGGNKNKISGGSYSSIAGGSDNQVYGDYASVLGGKSNIVRGYSSIVPGGERNSTGYTPQNPRGNYSFAAGYRAQARFAGSFVWSGSSTGHYDKANNEFRVLAGGGVFFESIKEYSPPLGFSIRGSLGGSATLNMYEYLSKGGGADPTYYNSGFRLQLGVRRIGNNYNDTLYLTSIGDSTLANTVRKRITWLNNGNVGIGTETPESRLDVNGVVNCFLPLGLSDLRFKTNIMPLSGVLDKIARINVVSFSWANNHDKDIGVIAQEVEKIFPELVTKDNSYGIKDVRSVNYSGLGVVLAEGVKELSKEVDDFKKDIFSNIFGQTELKDGVAEINLGSNIIYDNNYIIQLTCIDGYSPLFIKGKIQDNRFIVATTKDGNPSQKFYWQIKPINSGKA